MDYMPASTLAKRVDNGNLGNRLGYFDKENGRDAEAPRPLFRSGFESLDPSS